MTKSCLEENLEFPFEAAWKKDLYQYFSPNVIARSRSDVTLSALVQLTTHRLNTTRALISLVDRTHQYILIEATQRSRLLSDNDEDGLLFGRTTLPRSLGLCGTAIEKLSLQNEFRQKSWSLPSGPLIINDVTQDGEFKDQPFVTRYPSLRFYAAMPICTRAGFNIGVLCVMDEQPREGLKNTETEIFGDIAAAIMAHLEIARSHEGHRRSEKMIKSLGVFMEGRAELGDWWLKPKANKPRQRHDPTDEAEAPNKNQKKPGLNPTAPTPQRHISPEWTLEAELPTTSISSMPSKPLSSQSKSLMATPAKAEAVCAIEGPSVSTAKGDDSAISTPQSQVSPSHLSRWPTLSAGVGRGHATSPTPSRRQCTRTVTPETQESIVSQNIKDAFSRASNIIQECIEVDGVIFLDASISTLVRRTESIVPSEQTSTSDAELSEVSSAGSDHGHQPSEKNTCEVLGFCVGKSSSLHEVGASELAPLNEAVLQSLLHKYPQGHIFSPGEQGRIMASAEAPELVSKRYDAKVESGSSKKRRKKARGIAEHMETRALLQMLPGSRSVAFVPLWDSHRERWFAGGFVWTSQQTTRILTPTEDLNYLVAFGNSIMAEVARLDVIGADRAKSDFISSVSHELRSPLHGILASVEFLDGTTVDLFQHSMIDTIERCGRTLLDTIQHVLDFTKINNFIKSSRSGGQQSGPGEQRPSSERSDLGVNVDLSLLTEDVVNAVFSGHEFQDNLSLVGTDDVSGFPPEDFQRASGGGGHTAPNQPGSNKKRLDVVIDIDRRSNWTFNTQPGALRTVLINIFGNALKYTKRGWVKVSLQAKDIESTSPQPNQSTITISISDSGKGIAQEYLHSGLFIPFTQQDPMNPGTGLGLSIVLQIVRSLGGTISITSEQGVGTEVVVTLTLNQALPLSCEGGTIIQRARKKTSGLSIGLLGFDVNLGTPKRYDDDRKTEFDPSPSLQTLTTGIVSDWFDMEVAAPQTWEASPPDIYLINEQLGFRGVLTGGPIIVLCSHKALYRENSRRMVRRGQRSNDRLVHFISKPCGPHKLAMAFAFCLGNVSGAFRSSSSNIVDENIPSQQSLLESPENLEFMSPMDSHSRDGYFPLMTPSPTNESSLQAAAIQAEKRKPTLLLVEDNKINMQLLCTLLRKNEFEYDTAENGLVALQAFRKAQRLYDIVLMDISMPIMDGMEATREIRKLERDRQQKPATIIALTGLDSAASKQEAFSNGINLYLTKPVRFQKLRDILSSWNTDLETKTNRV